ncbi:hypothetical protein KR018_002736 [Drosophila ironensis]|nr:hypothetical protein KR018_002736 [Drosophila ironensis]
MVKVQKPQAKSLTKSNPIEGVSKQKNKSPKAKKPAPAAVKAVSAATNKKEKNAAPVKKADGGGVKPAKGAQKQKRPLVLAPPESPSPAPALSKKSKEKAPKKPAEAPKKEAKKVEAAPVVPAKKAAKRKAEAAVAPAQKPAQTAKKTQKPAAAPETKKKSAKAAKTAKPEAPKKAKPVQKLAKSLKAAKGKKPKNKKVKEVKKAKKPVELTFELKSFDEDKYKEIVCEQNVQKVCQALKKLVEEEVAKKKAIFTDYRYNLQVASYKIASCPKRVVKLSLKHSLVGSDDDVAIIVPDLQRGAKFDFEPTKQHYEDLLREAGVQQRLTVVPFNQLRNEMGTFEAKRKFLNTYDYLLCDGRLAGQATGFLGKFTQKPRNVLHAVRLNKENDKLSEEVSRALHRTAFRQLAKGDLTSIPVGNYEHSAQQLTENILLVSKQLQNLYPGGLANIRSLYLKIDIVGTSALPLYVSMCAPPADTPYVVGPREQRMLKLKKQANEVLSRFALTKDAEFIKLTSDQVKRKAEVREKKAALLAEDASPKDNDGDDQAVPTKKARKEASSESGKAEAEESDEGDSAEEEEESAGESGEDEDGEDEDDIEGEDDDDDDEDDDDEDDDEEDDDDDDDDDDDE